MRQRILSGSSLVMLTLSLFLFSTRPEAQMAQNETDFQPGIETLFLFSQYWKQTAENETGFRLDYHQDGILDEFDLLVLLKNWQFRNDRHQEITFILPGNIPLIMVRIPRGSYLMGSPDDELDRRENESPRHRVTIGYDFYLGKYEVTKAQWQAVMGTAPWAG